MRQTFLYVLLWQTHLLCVVAANIFAMCCCGKHICYILLRQTLGLCCCGKHIIDVFLRQLETHAMSYVLLRQTRDVCVA